jgi:2'-5' RNA ligase
MRAFFALEPDAQTALQVADWRDRQFAQCGRPVPPANFHITLAFLGELRSTNLERLCLSVDDWLDHSKLPGSELPLDCTGYWHKPGIYWLGAETWSEPLTRLAGKLRDLSSGVGGKRDKNNFQPHITLFRRCTVAPPAPLMAPDFVLPYQHFTLFESRQGKQGVSYHPLQHWDLPASGP